MICHLRYRMNLKVKFEAFLLLVLLSSCGSEPEPVFPLVSLARDVRISIADQIIRLPLIAMSRHTVCSAKDKFCGLPIEKIEANQPIVVNSLDIPLEDYSRFPDYRTEDSIWFPEICKMLSQEWARRVCLTTPAEKHIDFHEIHEFTLVREDSVNLLERIQLGNCCSVSKLLKKMKFIDKTPSSYCELDKQGKPASLCVAAIKVSNNLLAVWIVTRAGAEKYRIIYDAEIILAFMQFGIGETENFQALDSVLNTR